MSTASFRREVERLGIRFITGVPDSLLKGFSQEVEMNFSGIHLPAPNEGTAVGLALGHFLAKRQVPLIYMQNSGIGNALNPLISLASQEVFQIPLILLVGWRGEISADGYQLADEPQHVLQGKITRELLSASSIPFEIANDGDECVELVKRLHDKATSETRPVALVVRKGILDMEVSNSPQRHQKNLPTRASYIDFLANFLGSDVAVIATTGKISRELYVSSSKNDARPELLVVGGMGHASAIAVGVAASGIGKKVVCLDGDGAFLMHMGAGFLAATQADLIHIVLNNGCHESVGGQPTVAAGRALVGLAKEFGYSVCESVISVSELEAVISRAVRNKCSTFIEIHCGVEADSSLPRPRQTPLANSRQFMGLLS